MTRVRGSRLQRHLVDAALFALVPAGAAAAPLLVIPAVVGRWGAEGWASLAVALSIGLTAATIAELGWTVVGPQLVSRERDRAGLHAEAALASRLVAVGALAVPGAVIAGLLAPAHSVAAASVALGVSAGALSPAWFFVGLGRPGVVVLVETLPKAVAGLAAAAMITAGAPLSVYGLALIASVAVTVVLSGSVGHVRWPRRAAFRGVLGTVRRQRSVSIGRAVVAVYRALPATLLAVVAPAAVPAFAACDRPMRLGLQFLGAVPQRLQSWVGVPEPALAWRRTRRSIALNTLSGIVSGAVFVVAMPLVAPVLFGDAVPVPQPVVLAGGLLVVTICTCRGLGLALVTLDRAGATATVAVLSAVIAVPAVVVGAVWWGAAGAMLALTLAEAVGGVYQVAVILRARGSFLSGRPVSVPL